MTASDALKNEHEEIAALAQLMEKQGVQFKFKDELWWMRLVSYFVPDFNKYVTTTVGNTIYFPKNYPTSRVRFDVLSLLAHEYVHIMDAKKHKWFLASYIFPQIFAVLGLLAFFGPLYSSLYYFAFAFLFLAPLPSPFRLYWEVRGYSMTIAMEIWVLGQLSESTYKHVCETLAGKTYWMYVPKKILHKMLGHYIARIASGDIVNDRVFGEIQRFLLANRIAIKAK